MQLIAIYFIVSSKAFLGIAGGQSKVTYLYLSINSASFGSVFFRIKKRFVCLV